MQTEVKMMISFLAGFLLAILIWEVDGYINKKIPIGVHEDLLMNYAILKQEKDVLEIKLHIAEYTHKGPILVAP